MPPNATPDVAILITAHDAAATIGETLATIARQYRSAWHTAEIIVVDDRSTDGTADVALAVGLRELRVVRIDRYQRPSPPLTARQVALEAAIAASSAPILLVTDADAHAPRHWVDGMLSALADVDAVAGPIAFDSRQGHDPLAALQTVDASCYLGVCRALDAFALPAGMMFGNAAIRRAAWERIGGFARIGFALTEDLATARALHRSGCRLAFPNAPVIDVPACASMAQLVRRAMRTSVGPPSILAAVLGLWSLLLPLLLGMALVAGGRGWWLALIARYMVGAVFATYCTWRVSRTRLWVVALAYEAVAFAIGVRVLAARWRSDHVDWGGIRYARAAPARGSSV